MHRHLALGVYLQDALLHGLRLWLTYGIRQCFKLAVEVGDIHIVAIYKMDMSDAAACQSLCNLASDAAYSEDRNTG